MKKVISLALSLVLIVAVMFSASAQTTERKGWSPQAKGAVIGGATGAAAGAIIHKRNRVVGGAVGAVAVRERAVLGGCQQIGGLPAAVDLDVGKGNPGAHGFDADIGQVVPLEADVVHA